VVAIHKHGLLVVQKEIYLNNHVHIHSDSLVPLHNRLPSLSNYLILDLCKMSCAHKYGLEHHPETNKANLIYFIKYSPDQYILEYKYKCNYCLPGVHIQQQHCIHDWLDMFQGLKER